MTLHNESVIVSCNELKNFYGKTPDLAMANSMIYWNDIFIRLQDRLKVIMIKEENTCIKQFNGHFAEVDNELAKECNERKARVKIFAREDNKLWFTIDKSWNVNEAETVHPDTAQRDMQESVQPFFNDLREITGYTPQFVMKSLNELIEDRKYYAENLKSHVWAIKQLGTGISDLNKQVKKLKSKLSQKKLGEYT